MIKFTICLRRKAGMSKEDFYRYWGQNHAELVTSLAPALKIRRYVQLHAMDHVLNEVIRKTRGTLEPFDGIAETWYDSLESLEEGFATPEGREAGRKLRQDEDNFLDLSGCSGWVNTENVIIEG